MGRREKNGFTLAHLTTLLCAILLALGGFGLAVLRMLNHQWPFENTLK